MPVMTGGEGQGDGGGWEDTPERSAVAGGLEFLSAHQEGLRAILGDRNGGGDGRQHAGVAVVGSGGLGLE